MMNDEQFQKLTDRVERSFKRMRPYRESRWKALRQYAGNSHDDGHGDDTVVNLMELYVNVLLQNLVSSNPRANVNTDKRVLRANARYLSLAINHVVNLVDFQQSLRMAVMESLFSVGCLRVGVTPPERSQVWGWNNEGMLPFADPVYFDDLVWDMSAERIEQIAFIGNRYWEHVDDVKNDSRNDPEVASAVRPGDWLDLLNGENPLDVEQYPGEDHKHDEMVRLWDVWIPRQKILVTYAHDGQRKPLRIEQWDGPRNGPYHLLWYNCMPGNVMPVPPVANLCALGDLVNSLWNKMGEQASRQKTVTFVRSGNEHEGGAIVKTRDGDVISVINPDSIREVRYGGVDQTTLSFSALAKQMFSYMAGNLDTLAGLASGADTFGQEKLLAQSASGMIRSMQHEVVRITKNVMRDIGWYVWNDPLVRLNLSDSIPGTELTLELTWPMQIDEFGNEHDLRKGQYSDYNFDIQPFSLQDVAPSQRAQMMRSVFQQDVLPALPIISQQGMSIDMAGYLERLAELMNLKQEMQNMVRLNPAMEDEGIATARHPPKPAATTRQYERVVSRGGLSPSGLERQIAATAKSEES